MVVVDKSYFQEAASAYLRKETERPVIFISTTNQSALERQLEIHFSDKLLQEVVRNPIFGKKIIKALDFGYMGSSNGGINGIVNTRSSDENLNNRLASFLASLQGQEFISKHDLSPERLVYIKIVAHLPQGKRPIGFLDRDKKKVYLIGCESYKK